jgi:Leucine-rich repeat (LRR) protein
MNELLEYFKNIDNIEDSELQLTLKTLQLRSGAIIPEDADYYWQNQTKLAIQNAKLTNIYPLRFLLKLETVVLDGNYISDISSIVELPNLYHLNLIDNRLKSVSGIERLTNIRELFLGINLIEDISPLKIMSNLRMLGLKSNRITDIEPLKSLTKLVQLNLSGNLLTQFQVNSLKGALPGCKIIFE